MLSELDSEGASRGVPVVQLYFGGDFNLWLADCLGATLPTCPSEAWIVA